LQLTGYVAEHSAYHHGEASLQQTIVGLAQNFVGSNNVNLLTPSGQFGTRRMGGKDAASPRYIFTCLEPIARIIFHPDDDDLLTYLNDDGASIEPEFYVPVIPMVLVNGSDGIGTGYSSAIANYNPREVIANLRRKINGESCVPMTPFYYGFDGEVNIDREVAV
jgi:DNA topoisomerase-2